MNCGIFTTYTFCWKTKKIIQWNQKKYKSRLPNSIIEIKKLPGVGDYTANALFGLIYNEPRIAVDGNVKRVFSRNLNIKEKNINFDLLIEKKKVCGILQEFIKFKDKPIKFLYLCYSIFLVGLFICSYLMDLSILSFVIFFIVLVHLFYLQLEKLNIKDSSNCLKIFKSNNFLGFIVLIGILIGKF